jgi:hypothetical protein
MTLDSLHGVEADPLHVAISRLIGTVFMLMPTECHEREMAVGAVVELHGHIAALLKRRALN